MSIMVTECPKCNEVFNEDIESCCDKCGFNFEENAVCNNPFCSSVFSKEENRHDVDGYECQCPVCSSGYITPGSELAEHCPVCGGWFNKEEYDECPWCSD